jgi:hypothetical protein
MAAHRRLIRFERFATTIVNPVMTTVRAVRDAAPKAFAQNDPIVRRRFHSSIPWESEFYLREEIAGHLNGIVVGPVARGFSKEWGGADEDWLIEVNSNIWVTLHNLEIEETFAVNVKTGKIVGLGGGEVGKCRHANDNTIPINPHH